MKKGNTRKVLKTEPPPKPKVSTEQLQGPGIIKAFVEYLSLDDQINIMIELKSIMRKRFEDRAIFLKQAQDKIFHS
jgi:hypothetical protein